MLEIGSIFQSFCPSTVTKNSTGHPDRTSKLMQMELDVSRTSSYKEVQTYPKLRKAGRKPLQVSSGAASLAEFMG